MFEAYSTTTQSLATNGTLTLDNIKFSDCRISMTGNNTITLKAPGRYYVELNAVGGSTDAASPFTLQLFANGTAVPEAITTVTSTVANELHSLHTSTIINVGPSCFVCSGAVALKVVATATDTGTVANANLVVLKAR